MRRWAAYATPSKKLIITEEIACRSSVFCARTVFCQTCCDVFFWSKCCEREIQSYACHTFRNDSTSGEAFLSFLRFDTSGVDKIKIRENVFLISFSFEVCPPRHSSRPLDTILSLSLSIATGMTPPPLLLRA